MRIEQVIEALKAAGPLNIVWGAGCSYSGPNAAKGLMLELKVNCRIPVSGPAGIHDALKQLDRDRRREKTSGYGIDWAHICLGELLRAGRVARILTANFDSGVVKAASLPRVLPAFYEKDLPELAQSAIPSVYSLGEAEPAQVAGLIQRGAQTAAWLVIGASGEHFGLSQALLAVPHFEHGLYWVGYYNQSPPPALDQDFFAAGRGRFIPGFDADSFMAYLARGLAQFPPPFAVPEKTPHDPRRQLYLWNSELSGRIYRIRDAFLTKPRDLFEAAATARGAQYDQLVAEALGEYDFYFRWSPDNGHTGALFVSFLANRRNPREASLLRRKSLEWIDRFPAAPSMEAQQAQMVAEIYMHLARFRTGPEADALFRQAVEGFAPLQGVGRLSAYVAGRTAEVLYQWADQERGAEADGIFDRAREKYQEAHRLDPQRDREIRYCRALRVHAAAVRGPRTASLLAEARAIAGKLLSANSKDAAAWQALGLTALLEGNIAEAEPCLREAAALKRNEASCILCDWASTLGACAAARHGGEALDFFARAAGIFREAETIQPVSGNLYKNWSAVLLHEARERGWPAELREQARERAHQAEAAGSGSGAYNLACLAADEGDRSAVERWLTHSAGYGKIPPLSHILRDASFAPMRSDGWFLPLLGQIFDWNPANAA